MDKHNEKDSRRPKCIVQRFIGQKQNTPKISGERGTLNIQITQVSSW
jgi:hypothetical protein